MSLVADYDSDNSSLSSDHNNERKEKNFLDTPEKISSLPSAKMLLSGSTATGSVFNNPFVAAENAKMASLEKHVKMVDTEQKTVMKNGKKICWNYRKGRCRFGSNCQFAHDSDLHKSNENDKDIDVLPEQQIDSNDQQQQQAKDQLLNNKSQQFYKVNDLDNRKKKRPGLCDSIVPSKKVMTLYKDNKQK